MVPNSRWCKGTAQYAKVSSPEEVRPLDRQKTATGPVGTLASPVRDHPGSGKSVGRKTFPTTAAARASATTSIKNSNRNINKNMFVKLYPADPHSTSWATCCKMICTPTMLLSGFLGATIGLLLGLLLVVLVPDEGGAPVEVDLCGHKIKITGHKIAEIVANIGALGTLTPVLFAGTPKWGGVCFCAVVGWFWGVVVAYWGRCCGGAGRWRWELRCGPEVVGEARGTKKKRRAGGEVSEQESCVGREEEESSSLV